MSDGSKVLLGVLAGAAAGVLTGLLIAPTSGKETRDKITSKSEELLEAVKDLIEKEKETLKNVGKAKKEAEK
ncbi:MAG: YtxH domain-containing protein [Bacteroidota bacterium]|nr:YtxH domain-containing protein [Bacteroidota bacterium]